MAMVVKMIRRKCPDSNASSHSSAQKEKTKKGKKELVLWVTKQARRDSNSKDQSSMVRWYDGTMVHATKLPWLVILFYGDGDQARRNVIYIATQCNATQRSGTYEHLASCVLRRRACSLRASSVDSRTSFGDDRWHTDWYTLYQVAVPLSFPTAVSHEHSRAHVHSGLRTQTHRRRRSTDGHRT